MDLLKCRYKGATIIESLIAMIIIVVCFCIGTMINATILDSDKQRNQLKAILLLNEEKYNIKKDNIYVDGEKKSGDWTIKKTIKPYNNIENLVEMSLWLVDKEGRIILTTHELILVTE